MDKGGESYQSYPQNEARSEVRVRQNADKGGEPCQSYPQKGLAQKNRRAKMRIKEVRYHCLIRKTLYIRTKTLSTKSSRNAGSK